LPKFEALKAARPMTNLLFGEYTRSALDAQYNNIAACPQSEQIQERSRTLSLAARQAVSLPNVRWGESARESFDIYLPAEARGAPVVVFLHGGAWVSLDKESSAFAAPAFNAAGITFVAMGFHTAASVPFATMVDRVRTGIAWLIKNIASYRCDPARIVLVGHSSGTHLVTQCLTHDWTRLGVNPRPFSGAVLISGLCDLEPVRLCYRNERLKLTPEQVMEFSLKHCPVKAKCPVDVYVAEGDTDEFRRQSQEMAQILQEQGLLRNRSVLPGRNHFDIALDLADPASPLFGSVKTLL
jgi:arylformamidase